MGDSSKIAALNNALKDILAFKNREFTRILWIVYFWRLELQVPD